MGSLRSRASVGCLVVALAFSVSCSLLHREAEATPPEGEAAAPAEAAPKVPQKKLCKERLGTAGEAFQENVDAAIAAIQKAPDFEECKPVGPDGTLDVDTKDHFAEQFRNAPDLMRICFETKCHIVVIDRDSPEALAVQIFVWKGTIQPWEKSRPGVEVRQADNGDYYIFAKEFFLIGPKAKKFGGFMALEFSCDAEGLDFPWGNDALAVYDRGLFGAEGLVSKEKVPLDE